MKLMELFVEIMGDKAPLDHTLKEAEQHAKASGDRMGASIAQGFGIGAGIAAVQGMIGAAKGAYEWLHHSVEGAMDLNGAIFRLKIVMGESSEKAIAFAESMTKLGYGKVEILNAMRNFGDLSEQLGSTREQAEAMGETLTKLAANVSIAKPIAFADALGSMKQAAMGNERALRGLMEIVDPLHAKTVAHAAGVIQASGAMDKHAKAAALVALMQERFAYTSGLAEKAVDGARGQSRLMGVQMEELQEKIGQILLPAFTSLTSVATGALGGILDWLDKDNIWFKKLADTVTDLGVVIRNLGLSWDIAKAGAAVAISTMCDYINNNLKQDLSDAILLATTLWDTINKKGGKQAGKDAGKGLGGIDWSKKAPDALDFNPLTAFGAIPYMQDKVRQFADAFWNETPTGKDVIGKVGPVIADHKDFDESPATKILRDQLKELTDKMAALMAKAHKDQEHPTDPTARTPAGAGALGGKVQEATRTSLIEFYNKLQVGAFGKGAAEKTADGVVKIVALHEAGNELMKKAFNAPAAPAVAGA
jgi:hypothetical protein